VKPGVEQVLVTQLFLDVQMTIHPHEHLVLNRVDNNFELIFESEVCMHDIRGEPRPSNTTHDTMSLAAWETTPNGGGPSLDVTITPMNMYVGLNPVWMGLRLLDRLIGQKLRESSAPYVQWPTTAAAHLQNALSQLRHTDSPNHTMVEEGWESLDTAVQIPGQKNVFVTSELPKTLKGCTTHAKLATGAKVQDFAINKRRNVTPKVISKPRSAGLEVPMLRAIMFNYQHQSNMAGLLINPYASNIMEAMVSFQSTNGSERSPQEMKASLKAYSLEHFLGFLRTVMQLELGCCTFNYATVGKIFLQLLSDVHYVICDEFKKERNSTYVPMEAYLVPSILLTAEETALRAAKKDTDTTYIVSGRMQRVAEVFLKYKNDWGNEYLCELDQWCL
jgi:hypothetical protein